MWASIFLNLLLKYISSEIFRHTGLFKNWTWKQNVSQCGQNNFHFYKKTWDHKLFEKFQIRQVSGGLFSCENHNTFFSDTFQRNPCENHNAFNATLQRNSCEIPNTFLKDTFQRNPSENHNTFLMILSRETFVKIIIHLFKWHTFQKWQVVAFWRPMSCSGNQKIKQINMYNERRWSMRLN